MKKIFRRLLVLNAMVSLCFLAKVVNVTAKTIDGNKIDQVYEYMKSNKDLENQIVYLSDTESIDDENIAKDASQVPILIHNSNVEVATQRASRTTETKDFTYNFKNYVNMEYQIYGMNVSKITFHFTTTQWSNSNGFYVRGYKHNASIFHDYSKDDILVGTYISKYSSSSQTYTLTLQPDIMYNFTFYNETQGEQVVGSGSWTVTYR